jgi:hypothetical protein
VTGAEKVRVDFLAKDLNPTISICIHHKIKTAEAVFILAINICLYLYF